MFSSCKKEEILAPTQTGDSIEFMGETLILRKDISPNDVKLYLNANAQLSQNLRVSVNNPIDWSLIPLDIFQQFVKESLKSYPNLAKDEFDDKDFVQLKGWFPEFKSKKEAHSKKSTIFEYLNIQVKKDIEKMAIKYLKGAKLKKVMYTINPTENYLKSIDPLGAFWVSEGAGRATYLAGVLFGSGNIDKNDGANAFLHFLWNALAVKELCHFSGNKWTSLERTKKFTCAHEYSKTIIFVPAQDNINAMDLHNNMAGRTYMYETVGQTWLGNANNIPSENQILNKVFYLVNTNVQTKADIQAILAMSSNYNWNSLQNFSSAMNYHTPTKDILIRLP